MRDARADELRDRGEHGSSGEKRPLGILLRSKLEGIQEFAHDDPFG